MPRLIAFVIVVSITDIVLGEGLEDELPRRAHIDALHALRRPILVARQEGAKINRDTNITEERGGGLQRRDGLEGDLSRWRSH